MTDEKSEYQKQLEEVTYINSTFGRISEQQAVEGIKRILEDQNTKPMTIREGLIPYRMYGEGDDRYYIYVDRDGVRYRKRYRLNSSDVFDFEPIDKEEKKTMPNYTTSQPTDYTFYGCIPLSVRMAIKSYNRLQQWTMIICGLPSIKFLKNCG
jgi:hypothetical protein